MNLICSKCEDDNIGIVSVTQIQKRQVEIIFVCNNCGATKVTKNYLYKDMLDETLDISNLVNRAGD